MPFPRRPSTSLFLLLAVGLLLLLGTLLDGLLRREAAAPALAARHALAAALELTDLSLFTEARYTRHLTQADRHTPFQDHPLALDHFPSGALVAPPARLERP